jgi:PAS domain S-box-containing protein
MTAPNADGGEAGFGSQRDAAPDSRPPSAGPKHETKGADAELAGLRARLARCETLLAAVAPIQWTLAADGRCMQANPSWEDFTGQDHSAARGTGWLVAIHPDDRDKTVAAWREATSNRQAVRLAHRVRRRDGAFRWMEMHAAPVRDPATGVQAWAGLHTDVSEQYAAMETAQANEVRLRLALKAGGLASWDLDVGTGRIVTTGDLPEMFGIEPVTLNGTVAPFVARIHPEDRTGVLREFAAAARQGGAYRCEFRVVRATDGAIRWLVGVAEGVRGIDGSVHVIGYNADVTDQVEAEAALSDSEARFRATFQQAAVGIAQLTPDGRWLRVNDRFCAITGYSREALLARRFQDITHPDDLEADLAQVQALLEGRIARYSLEKRYIRPDGAVEWVNLTVSLVRDAGGAPDYFISVVEDITPRKQAEAALAESEARLRLATEAGQVGVFDWDLRTDELRWDDQLRAIWALPIGTTVTPAVFFAGLCPEDRKQLQAVIETCRDPANGEHFAAEYRVIGQTDGAERHVAARWRVEFEHGSAVRIIGTAADVTPLRRAAEVLAHDKAELERLVEQRTAALLRAADDRRRAEESARQAEKLAALGSLTGGVAHDFNNLLQVIASGAELLKRGHLTGERRAKLLDGIAQAGERGRDLTGRLLSFARRQPLRPTLVDVTARLARMSELLRQTLGSRIQVVTDIAPELWPVRADASQLEVALLNLAVNGRDAMPNGGTVTIAARNERLPATGNRLAGDYVRISVRDTGKGHAGQRPRPRAGALLHHKGTRARDRSRLGPGARVRQAIGRRSRHRERAGSRHDGVPAPAMRGGDAGRGRDVSCRRAGHSAACPRRGPDCAGGRGQRGCRRLHVRVAGGARLSHARGRHSRSGAGTGRRRIAYRCGLLGCGPAGSDERHRPGDRAAGAASAGGDAAGDRLWRAGGAWQSAA